MSVRCYCCETFEVRKLLCGLDQCCGCFDGSGDEQILYRDVAQQIIILSTPQVFIPDLVEHDHLDEVDVVVFSADEEGEIRIVSSHGKNMFRNAKLSPVAEDEKDTRNPACSGEVAGQTLEETLPTYLTRFLKSIFQQTLQGNHLQLSVMWMGITHLIRTFPTEDHRKNVIGGTAVISPYKADYHTDVNRFALQKKDHKSANREARKRRSRAAKPATPSTSTAGLQRFSTRRSPIDTTPPKQFMTSIKSGTSFHRGVDEAESLSLDRS